MHRQQVGEADLARPFSTIQYGYQGKSSSESSVCLSRRNLGVAGKNSGRADLSSCK